MPLPNSSLISLYCTAHSAFTDDALIANNMNVKPGGAIHKMHDTIIPVDNLNPKLYSKPQTMVFVKNLLPDNLNYKHHSEPKGFSKSGTISQQQMVNSRHM